MKEKSRSLILRSNLLESLWFYLSWVDVGHRRLNFILKSFSGKPRTHGLGGDLPMILIGQVQRSGGTLMAQLFDGHSQVNCHPPELYWGKPKKWNWPDFHVDEINSNRDFYYLLYQSWITDGAAKGALEFGKASNAQSFPFRFNVRYHRGIFFRLLDEHSASSRRDVLNSYLEAFYAAWLDYKNSSGNKKFHVAFIPRTSMHEESVKRFIEDYPDGFLIHIFRHPAAWWASARKHQKQYEKMDSLELWEISTQSGIKMKKKYKEKVICINFENLTTNTEMTMQNICQYIGLDWERILLIPTFNSMPVSADSSFVNEQAGLVSSKVIERYKKHLAQEEIDEINKKYLALYFEAKDYCLNK